MLGYINCLFPDVEFVPNDVIPGGKSPVEFPELPPPWPPDAVRGNSPPELEVPGGNIPVPTLPG